ncbi:hypothetical protein FBZ89_114133 [Nitrospirillum amazonense]|uniref:Uncharacterized protein n=1 Tax=Nitrospirillum amazonense TaxID=28077 RepID=A0A560F1P6_9PROT|nr:hypothetical protein [Nitrospirillum amazonense]TWB15539.1 hypothetical protein FBZ89_114133 [Nitrospirillum amazonense]
MKQTTNDTASTTAAGPLYHAFHVAETASGKRWIRIGTVFAHEDGQGASLILDALPFNFDGRVVLRTPKAE